MSECIFSPYAVNSDGYAQVEIAGKKIKHHRLIYCQHHNVTLDSIQGKVVRHTYDTPNCVNPEHLLTGTQKDNAADRDTRGRNGYSNFRSRVSLDDLLIIRDSTEAQVTLAKRYNVSHVTIGKIKACKGAYSYLAGLTATQKCV